MVVCTGGTGLGPRDVTPDAVLRVIDRELPGFGEAFRARGREQTPLADLSRAVAGSMGSTLVVAVPGSHAAVQDALAVLGPLLGHAHHVVQGADHRGLVRNTPITAAEAVAAVQRPDAGAVVTFEGRVRNHDHDRPVTALTYEAHPDADATMAQILDEARDARVSWASPVCIAQAISRSATSRSWWPCPPATAARRSRRAHGWWTRSSAGFPSGSCNVSPMGVRSG